MPFLCFVDGNLKFSLNLAKKLENIAAQGIRQYGWLGETTSSEEAYEDGYVVREIGLAMPDKVDDYMIIDRDNYSYYFHPFLFHYLYYCS